MKGLTVFEIVIAGFIIAVLAYFSFPVYRDMLMASKETVISQELKTFRNAIDIYKTKYGKYPDNLEELEKEGYISFNGKSEEFINIKVNKRSQNGSFLDSYGNPYMYNKINGIVSTSSLK